MPKHPSANQRLLDFMQGVEEGDELKIDYLRNGKHGSVELTPRVMEMHAFSWAPEWEQAACRRRRSPVAPESVRAVPDEVRFPICGGAWGSMELVELNAGLGKYFGADTGLLIVRAPR